MFGFFVVCQQCGKRVGDFLCFRMCNSSCKFSLIKTKQSSFLNRMALCIRFRVAFLSKACALANLRKANIYFQFYLEIIASRCQTRATMRWLVVSLLFAAISLPVTLSYGGYGGYSGYDGDDRLPKYKSRADFEPKIVTISPTLPPSHEETYNTPPDVLPTQKQLLPKET